MPRASGGKAGFDRDAGTSFPQTVLATVTWEELEPAQGVRWDFLLSGICSYIAGVEALRVRLWLALLPLSVCLSSSWY